MSYRSRMLILFLFDSLIVFSSVYLAHLMAHAGELQNNLFDVFKQEELIVLGVILLVFYHVFALLNNMYKKAWEYASVSDLLAILKTVTFSVFAVTIIANILLDVTFVSIVFDIWVAMLLLIAGSRLAWRVTRENIVGSKSELKRVLIVGAGSAGAELVRQLRSNSKYEMQPVALVDDDVAKQNVEINGVKVVGRIGDIVRIVDKYEVEEIILAIPSLNKKDSNIIFGELVKTGKKIVTLPKIEEVLITGNMAGSLRDVEVEDLLGREPVELDINDISKKISGKVVLVTGAGGSIGSEICRQICKYGPRKIMLLGHGENSIYQIDMEIRNTYKGIAEVKPIIADVQDRKRIFEVVNEHRPDIIYHAAAHKHVPLMEYYPKESVKNNVLGTKNVAEAADRFGVKNFVLISSDKAVNPTNVMGSTKRIAEMIVQNLSQTSKTNFVAVRFGNVLGSRGSVIPLFKKQIAAGGPVTVTHPEMTRYFMTIPEASRLVIQAGALAKGGELFVLDMGEPVKISDLAKNLIELSGYSVEEIGIEFTGLRPGEKMYEELLNEDEIHSDEVFNKIFIGKTVDFNFDDVDYIVNNYETMSDDEVKSYVLDLANNKGRIKV